MDDIKVTPEELSGGSDPGDEIFGRFRYQATYAATLAVIMLDDSYGIDEVYCELRDDVLLKMRSGKYHAIQVKTQQPGGNPWKTNDSEMKSTIDRFVSFEKDLDNVLFVALNCGI